MSRCKVTGLPEKTVEFFIYQ